MAKTYYGLIDEMTDDFLENYEDEIKEQIKEQGEKVTDVIFDNIYQEWDLNSKIHEWLDSSWHGFLREDCFENFNSELTTCAFILDESDEVETDSGLWEGQEPKKAIQTQAFFTVKSDLYFKIEKKIKEKIEKMLEGGEDGEVTREQK